MGREGNFVKQLETVQITGAEKIPRCSSTIRNTLFRKSRTGKAATQTNGGMSKVEKTI